MPLFKHWKILLMAGIITLVQSCSYAIRISNKNGTAEDAVGGVNNELGFYNGKKVIKIDTVVKLSLLQNGVGVIDSACPIGGFHSIEYKITFGAMLRNTFTFGKKKSVKLKLTCLSNPN